jgi:hypothetical protein
MTMYDSLSQWITKANHLGAKNYVKLYGSGGPTDLISGEESSETERERCEWCRRYKETSSGCGLCKPSPLHEYNTEVLRLIGRDLASVRRGLCESLEAVVLLKDILAFDIYRYCQDMPRSIKSGSTTIPKYDKTLEAARKAAIKLKKLSDADFAPGGMGRQIDVLSFLKDQAEVYFAQIMASEQADPETRLKCRQKCVNGLRELLFEEKADEEPEVEGHKKKRKVSSKRE